MYHRFHELNIISGGKKNFKNGTSDYCTRQINSIISADQLTVYGPHTIHPCLVRFKSDDRRFSRIRFGFGSWRNSFESNTSDNS